jgi:hypothetical protein
MITSLLVVSGLCTVVSANEVDIALQVVTSQPVQIGELVRIDLVLSSSKDTPTDFDALGAVIGWDPTKLQLLNNDQAFDSASEPYFAGFLPDADLINEVVEPLTPTDGDAYFQAFTFGQSYSAPPAPGQFIATSFIFEALTSTPGTTVQLIPTMGVFGLTSVAHFGGDVTGTIGGPVSVSIGSFGACCTPDGCVVLGEQECSDAGGFFYGDGTACPDCSDDLSCTIDSCDPATGTCVNKSGGCPTDLSGDCIVGPADLAELLATWGTCDDPRNCPADFNDDDVVGPGDLGQLLATWGPCPR